MKMNFDVLIAGGGMVGAALACALGGGRLKVGLLDARGPAPAPAKEYDLRVSAITLASRALFENVGAWDEMQRRRVAPVEAMQVWEGPQAGEGGEPSALPRDLIHFGKIRFDAADIGEPCLNYIIENSVIQHALVERLHGFTNVHCLWPVTIESIQFDAEAARVFLQDGRQIEARLLVGADGADSAVRQAAGITCRSFDMDQKGIVAIVRTGKPHERTARQRFLATGPLAFLPLAEPDLFSIVWSADTKRAETLMALDDAGFAAELQAAFGELLGRIVLVSQRQAFRLALAHAHSYIGARVVLAGDAAHTVHPLAGQGVNLGFMDAAMLAGLVLDADARGGDIGASTLLRRYERARKAENLGMVALTGGFKYLFGSSWPLVRRMRNLGLGITDVVTPLKRAIMRRASGLEGDLPALVKKR